MAVISHRSKRFRAQFSLLPTHIQELARKNFRLWKSDPWHPSINYKEVKPRRMSARVGDHYLVLGSKQPDGTIVWTWIGPHETYNKLLRQR